jgi:type IV pilus assembly protein PilV
VIARLQRPAQRHIGFSMVEVMAALVVISVGLLGVAKMQALALSSTSVARARSLAALEAAGIASAMHQNRAYWSSNAPAAASPIQLQGVVGAAPTITTADGSLEGAANCTSGSGMTPCAPPTLAASDLQDWGASLQSILPGYQATVVCGSVSPVSCTITITWNESTVALDKQESQAQAANINLQAPIYTLYVEP